MAMRVQATLAAGLAMSAALLAMSAALLAVTATDYGTELAAMEVVAPLSRATETAVAQAMAEVAQVMAAEAQVMAAEAALIAWWTQRLVACERNVEE